ncbi:MAG: PAS domain S-box protein [Thermoplasmatota archaeon]
MPIKTLLVDDERALLEQAEIFLERIEEEIEVQTAPSPKKALDLLEENDFDVIVSDYQMPVMDGLEFLEEIRKERENEVPFIMFTGKGREEVAMEALNLGADRYLQKGGDPGTQYSMLIKAIKQEVKHFRTKESRQDSEEKYRRLFETAQDGMIIMLILDAESGEIKDANPYIQDLTGFSKEELVGKDLWEIGTFKNIVESKERFKELVEEGYIRYEDLPLETKGGVEVSVEFISNTYESGGEKVLQCNIRKISERKEKEEKIQRLKEAYKDLLDSLNDPVLVHDHEGSFLAVNDAAKEYLGYSEEEWLSMNLQDIVAPESAERIEERKRKLKKKKTLVFESNHITREGKKIPVETNSTLTTFRGERAFVSVVRDITERKEMEKELRKSEEKYRSLVENLNEVIYILNENAEIEYVSPNVEGVSGYSPSELAGKSFVELVHPDDLDGRIEQFEKVLSGEGEPAEYRFVTKNEDVRWVRTHARPIIEEGRTVGAQGILADITDQRKSEEREKFLHSLLRHDVGNKSQIVKGYLKLMRDHDLPDEVKDFVDKAERATNESTEIIEKVRKLREIEQEEEIGEVDLGSMMDKVLSEHKDRLEERGINIDMAECDCNVRGGPLLKEIFSNLVENSIQHSDCNEMKIYSQIEEDECVVIVEDDGAGIPYESKEKIFDKGFKRGETAGTGLGLYMVKEIAESYGGKVEVKDSEMGGARFEIRLKKTENLKDESEANE